MSPVSASRGPLASSHQRVPMTGKQTTLRDSAASIFSRHLPGPMLATSRNTLSRPKAMRSQSYGSLV